ALAGQQYGDGDRGEQRGARSVEQSGVQAIDKGGAGGGLDRAAGVDGQSEGAACLVGQPGRNAGQVQVAAVDGGDDAADNRDAQRAAHLAGQVVERGSDALLSGGQRFGDRGGGGGDLPPPPHAGRGQGDHPHARGGDPH